MHRGCFVWTPTPPLAGRRTSSPGSARLCVRVLCLPGSGGPASRACSGAPHSFLWLLCPCSLFGLIWAWVALFAVCFFLLPFVRPRCLWRSVFSGPGCLGPWRLVRPPPFLFCIFAAPPPPPPFLFLAPWCFVPCVFFLFFFASALFVVFFYIFLFCRFRGAVSLCVFVAVGCAGVWCCWRCGLWCVVCIAWCCVAFLCLAGSSCLAARRGVALGPVGLFLLCSVVACCCVFCWFFFCVVPCLSVVVPPVSICVVLGRGGSCFLAWPCRVAFLCWLLVRCAVWCSAVPCCGVCFVAVLGSCLASSAAVACCCALSVLGRDAVLSCRVTCGPCAVVPCAVFLGASLFTAPLVWCSVGVPVWLLSVRCSLAPLALAGVVCCCLLCSGVCCWAWPSSVVSRCRVSVVLSLSRRVARRPVVWCGVSGCSAPLCCVLWCCAVAWWCAVLPCCLFASLPVPVVCFLALRFLLCVSWCASLWLVGLLWRPAPLCCVLWYCAVV